MEKLKDELSLYEWIEEIKKSRVMQNDNPALQALQALQSDLSLCNNSNNFVTHTVTSTLQGRYNDQKPKQDPCPVAVSDAELISRNLQYLNGIDEDLTDWTLWKRIEDGREHRFAIDASGGIRWETFYLLEPRLILADGIIKAGPGDAANIPQDH